VGHASDDLLGMIAEKGDRLACKIQETYGVTKDQAEKQLSHWQGARRKWHNPSERLGGAQYL